jgi:hypothetical protein
MEESEGLGQRSLTARQARWTRKCCATSWPRSKAPASVEKWCSVGRTPLNSEMDWCHPLCIRKAISASSGPDEWSDSINQNKDSVHQTIKRLWQKWICDSKIHVVPRDWSDSPIINNEIKQETAAPILEKAGVTISERHRGWEYWEIAAEGTSLRPRLYAPVQFLPEMAVSTEEPRMGHCLAEGM